MGNERKNEKEGKDRIWETRGKMKRKERIG